MTNETRRIIRDGFGHIEDELRAQRGKLDHIIRLLGGENAKVQAIREDHDALTEKVAGHERRLLRLGSTLADG